jgi:MYXO-CTERM domain-containing protein
MRRALAAALLLVAAAPARAQFCPSYTLSSSANNNDCGVEAVPGTNPSVAEWLPLFLTVSGGPVAWGPDGPAVADINEGCGKPMPKRPIAAVFPCELLKAIAMAESGWKQFCVPTTPADQKGGAERTIISFDCGYGVGQVTSGMHKGEMPAYDRGRVAGEALYSLATGASILAAKWRATSCVGDNVPKVIEDWYIATWAYNGLAYSNNPNNPNYDAARPACDPSKGCGSRPYQEKVWGWMEFPRSAAHAAKVEVAYPDRGDIPTMSGVKIPELAEPACAGPTDCVNARATHVSSCLGPPAAPADMATEPQSEPPDLGVVVDPNAPGLSGGCGCQASGGAGRAAVLWLLLLAWTLARRRRRA